MTRCGPEGRSDCHPVRASDLWTVPPHEADLVAFATSLEVQEVAEALSDCCIRRTAGYAVSRLTTAPHGDETASGGRPV